MTQTKICYYAKIGNMYVSVLWMSINKLRLSKYEKAELGEREIKYLKDNFDCVEITKVTVTTEEEVL